MKFSTFIQNKYIASWLRVMQLLIYKDTINFLNFSFFKITETLNNVKLKAGCDAGRKISILNNTNNLIVNFSLNWKSNNILSHASNQMSNKLCSIIKRNIKRVNNNCENFTISAIGEIQLLTLTFFVQIEYLHFNNYREYILQSTC